MTPGRAAGLIRVPRDTSCAGAAPTWPVQASRNCWLGRRPPASSRDAWAPGPSLDSYLHTNDLTHPGALVHWRRRIHCMHAPRVRAHCTLGLSRRVCTHTRVSANIPRQMGNEARRPGRLRLRDSCSRGTGLQVGSSGKTATGTSVLCPASMTRRDDSVTSAEFCEGGKLLLAPLGGALDRDRLSAAASVVHRPARLGSVLERPRGGQRSLQSSTTPGPPGDSPLPPGPRQYPQCRLERRKDRALTSRGRRGPYRRCR